MIFRDVTISGGAVLSRRVVDARELAAPAVSLCAGLLSRLRSGALEIPHGVEGLPTFTVRLGMPAGYGEAPGNRLIFCVGAPGETAFQYNCVIHETTEPEPGIYGIASILGVSGAHGMTATALAEIVMPLYEERPIVVATVLPTPGADPERVMIAADFATCFAAAWLEEGQRV